MVATSTRLFGLHGPRYPQLGLALRKEETAWHHANNCERFAIERDVAIHDRRIAIEATLPEAFAEHDDVVLTGLIFIRQKRPAQRGFDAKNRKDISGDELAVETLRLRIAAGKIDVLGPVGSDALECLALIAEVEKVGGRDFVLVDSLISGPAPKSKPVVPDP